MAARGIDTSTRSIDCIEVGQICIEIDRLRICMRCPTRFDDDRLSNFQRDIDRGIKLRLLRTSLLRSLDFEYFNPPVTPKLRRNEKESVIESLHL